MKDYYVIRRVDEGTYLARSGRWTDDPDDFRTFTGTGPARLALKRINELRRNGLAGQIRRSNPELDWYQATQRAGTVVADYQYELVPVTLTPQYGEPIPA